MVASSGGVRAWPRIDTRIALAALYAALEARQPTQGCIHHSDRGTQYASELYRKVLKRHGLIGSMGRRGNPYDNAKAESFMKTLKCEIYLNDYRAFTDVVERLPHFIEQVYNKNKTALRTGHLAPVEFEEQHTPPDLVQFSV